MTAPASTGLTFDAPPQLLAEGVVVVQAYSSDHEPMPVAISITDLIRLAAARGGYQPR